MKKIGLITLSVIIVLITVAGWLYYSTQRVEKVVDAKIQNVNPKTNGKDMREIVWEQMPTKLKNQVKGTWKDGKVDSRITLGENSIVIAEGEVVKDKSYAGKEVYVIDFPTKDKGIPNNMLVYADVNTFNFIGNGPVD